MIYFIVRQITRFISFFLFPAHIHGLKNMPKKGAFILACNHASYLDPVVIGNTSPRYLNFMARDTLFRHKLLGWLLRRLQTFPVKRNSADIGALKYALKKLQNGEPVVLFPEGTRKAEAKELNSGIGFLVAKSRAPVLPVYVSGTDKALPASAKMIKRHPVHIVYGPLVEYPSDRSADDITKGVVEGIYSLKDRFLSNKTL